MALLHQTLKERLERFGRLYEAPARRSLFWGSLWLLLLAVALGCLVARSGTLPLRALGGGVFLATIAGLLVAALRGARLARDPAAAARRAVGLIDPARGAELGRALALRLRLTEAPEGQGESAALAELFVWQVVERVPEEELARAGRQRGRRLMFGALGVMGLAVFLWVGRVVEVAEGLSVLLARDGVGAWPVAYLAEREIRARPPAHLAGRAPLRLLDAPGGVVLSGSEIVYRIVPRFGGRQFLLTSGAASVPFVDDGQGALVARIVAKNSGVLRVAVRFGDVLVYDASQIGVEAEPDRAPVVTLDGAPAERELRGLERLDLSYHVVDDHGVASVELVVRTGQREQRRTLVRLDGQRQRYDGGEALLAGDRLLRSAYLPVSVTIEARDADETSGPNWGRSAAIVLVPPALGAALAERHRALREFRSATARYVAAELEAADAGQASAVALRREAARELEQQFGRLRAELAGSEELPRGALRFLSMQLARLGEGDVDGQQLLLATDVLLADLSRADARRLAARLADAVEEIATVGRSRGEGRAPSAEELSGLLVVARRGAEQLREVGELGLDLGSVAVADLARVERSLSAGELDHAASAAQHLAERLRRGTPSFGAQGAGVESGSPQGRPGPGSGAPRSRAPGEFERAGQELRSLAEEHGENLGALEQLLEQARQAAASDSRESGALTEAAESLRRAVDSLPELPGAQGDALGDAARARRAAEALAESLEQGAAKEALERADAAGRALEAAERTQDQLWDPAFKDSLAELRAALGRAREVAARAAREFPGSPKEDALKERAARERALAERASALARRQAQGGPTLPGDVRAALEEAERRMREAVAALERGDGEAAAERAALAQRALERTGLVGQEDEGGDAEPGPRADVEVPGAAEDRARAFRERVERGLGTGAGRLAPAAKRYAEELK